MKRDRSEDGAREIVKFSFALLFWFLGEVVERASDREGDFYVGTLILKIIKFLGCHD